MKYNLVVCGGTFDHFHEGHISLLKLAFSLGRKVVIGVTSDVYAQNSKFPTTLALRGTSKIRSFNKVQDKNPKLMEPFGKRKQAVLEFTKARGVLGRVEIVKINDILGPTLSKDFPIDAIVVSEDTKKGAEYINRKRKELGLSPLKVFIVGSIKAEDGRLISSARIRNGEINREGKLYVKELWFKKNLKLTEDLRGEFQKPFGELFKNTDYSFKNKNSLVITVGDVTTKKFNELNLGQQVSVIDFKVAREKKFSNIEELGFRGNEDTLSVVNPAGYITKALLTKCTEIFKSDIKDKVILQVNGEEDLAVLPLVLLSPLNTIIYYGQQARGVVKVVVSEVSKSKAYSLVSKLKPM